MSDAAKYNPHSRGSDKQAKARETLLELFRDTPLPPEQLLTNLGLYTRSGPVAKFLFLDEIYQQILQVPGDVIEFGTWWGQSLVTFLNLRAVYEPYCIRKVIGFDTFAGYQTLSARDRQSDVIQRGNYSVSKDYESYLARLLDYHEAENVLSHIKKFELVRGDIAETVPKYFSDRPEAVVALAYFDLAIYEPTKIALQAVKDRVVKGSLLVFDEFSDPDYPGETEAIREVLGLRSCVFRRSRYLPARTYAVVE